MGADCRNGVRVMGREVEDGLQKSANEIKDGITKELPALIEGVALKLAKEASARSIKEALDNAADVIAGYGTYSLYSDIRGRACPCGTGGSYGVTLASPTLSPS